MNSEEAPDLTSGAANSLRVGVVEVSSIVLLVKAVGPPELVPWADAPVLSVADSGVLSLVAAESKGTGDTSLLVARLGFAGSAIMRK